MELADLLRAEGITPAELARRAGCDKSYVSHVLAGRKKLGRPTAIAIWQQFGVKLGPLADVSDADIRTLRRLVAKGAA